jgi:hypothetical protein
MRVGAALAAIALAAALPSPALAAEPIPGDPAPGPVPEFEGAPVAPRQIPFTEPPRHPFMAPNGRSNLHVDAFQTDVHTAPGPLGRSMEVRSTLQTADCASVTFDSGGRIVTICVGLEGPRIVLMEPRSLDTLARMPLPPRQPGGGNVFQDFAGGGYFYLDERDRAIVPTTTRHIWVIAVVDGPLGPAFQLERDYDVTGAVPPGDKIISALPDWSGRIWFASVNGVVGTLDPTTGDVRTRDLGEPNGNSFSVDDSGGVYIVTDAALYRFDAAADGTPQVTWREVYPNTGVRKPGQTQAGSGTTPTVMDDGLVAITDNDDPMHVAVYRRGRDVQGTRLVCRVPVFQRGASATDQSLIAAGGSIVAENNYGYTGPSATMDGATTTPGLERVDVDPAGRNCRSVWRSNEVAPSVVPKLSAATGLVYTYTKPAREDETDAWYLTALDFCTGRTVYRRLAGTGFGYNNNYAPVTLGPDGTAYVGVLGGLVAIRDGEQPAQGSRGRGCPSGRPRVALRLRFRRDRTATGRRCARAPVRARVVGRDRGRIRRVAFRLGRRSPIHDARPPFTKRIDRGRHVGRPHRHVIAARVRMSDGRRVTLRRRLRFCAREGA